jgi:signal transduction histidine kinase/DNA-binding response OmpR family regulator
MKKSIVATYFGSVTIATMLLGLSLFLIAIEKEKTNRVAIETLVESWSNTNHRNTNAIKTSLKSFLGKDVLLTAKQSSSLKIHWQSRFASTSDSLVWAIVFGFPFIFLLCLVLVPTVLYRRIFLPQAAQILELTNEKREHQSMQMFAHDIRKPFSALKALLDILNKRSATSSLEAVVQRLLPEVDSLLVHVDGMITDLIRGNKSKEKEVFSSVCSLDKILDAGVLESAKKHPHSFLPISWNLQHTLKPNGPEKALVRCFSNLICNAIEAISPEERLWIKSRDSRINSENAIEVTIGNSGKPIPKEILSKLFDPFFTSGKLDGTGLGLAYVKNTLEDIGGYAAARSEEARGTEFILTIPAMSLLDKVTRDLPSHINTRKDDAEISNNSNTLLKVLVIEDQQIYFESLKIAAKDCSQLGLSNDLHHAKNYHEAMVAIEKDVYDLVICDIDLDSHEGSGIDVIKRLKDLDSSAQIYIYSNKSLTPNEQRFVEVMSHGTMRKPVSTLELQKVLRITAAGKTKRPVVAIIDDDCFVREIWSMQNDMIETHLFASPEEFLQKITDEIGFLDKFDAIIVDYYFAEESTFTGDQVAKKIRELVTTPIIMASDVQSLSDDSLAWFDGQISKDCQSWDEVKKFVQACA